MHTYTHTIKAEYPLIDTHIVGVRSVMVSVVGNE